MLSTEARDDREHGRGDGCVCGAGKHLGVRMVCWDGGVERQFGWNNGQVDR